jgi:hypothetical protein
MMMSSEFRNWLFGIMFFILITWLFYSFNALIFPSNHFNFLECFGILMIGVVIKTGIDSLNKEE